MDKNARIYIAGHTGLIGSAILNKLEHEGYIYLITRTREELDLTRQSEVEDFFLQEKPDYVFAACGRVGGICANMRYPAEFLYENIQMQTNIINAAYLAKIKKLLYFGSACSYPAESKQPVSEELLLTGPLEPTNEAYAIAKIAGIKMCQAYNKEYGTNFIAAVLTNAYGPRDNFSCDDAHVIPALIRRFHQAKKDSLKEISIWGSGRPVRDFIFSQDLACAAIFLMRNYDKNEIINVSSEAPVTIKALAGIIGDVVGFTGRIVFDSTKPDGMLRKALDAGKLHGLGWRAKISLRDGVNLTYKWFLEHEEEL